MNATALSTSPAASNWPAGNVPELDEDRWELTGEALRPFVVFSATGRVLDRFTDRWQAVNAMRRWPQAVCVVQGADTVARKDGEA